jgi:hypothetical protein
MKLFLVHLKSPSRVLKEIEVEIKVCKKTVWAIEKDGARHLLGSSVFQTLPAAERCRTALLQRLVDDKYIKYAKPDLWGRAKRELERLH